MTTTIQPEITGSTLFTAACLWEAALDYLNRAEPTEGFAYELKRYRERHGTAQLRDDVARLASACDAAWDALTDEQQEAASPFDWAFAPEWLAQNFFRIVRGW